MFKTCKINDEIHLHYRRDKGFKTITTAIFIRTPLEDKKATKTALVAECLRGGCEKYPSMSAISKELEDMWGGVYEVAVIKRGDEQVIYLCLESIKKDFDKAMSFLGEIMFKDNMNNTEFIENGKDRLKETIKSIKDDAVEYAIETMVEKLAENCDNHFKTPAFGIIENVDEITKKDLKNHWKTMLMESPIEIFVIGDENEEKVITKTKNLFHKMKRQALTIETKVFSRDKRGEAYVEGRNLNQARLAITFSFGVKDTKKIVPLLVLNEILGGGVGSYLYNSIRESYGLCYSINSFVFKQKMLLVVQSGIDKNSFQMAIRGIREEVKKLSIHITKADIETAKKALIKEYNGYMDTPYDMINTGFSLLILNKDMNLEKFKDSIKSVKEEEVIELAKEMKEEISYFLQ